MEVPLKTRVADPPFPSGFCDNDVISEPGAKMSTQDPQLEYDARVSVLVVAPTVIALAAEAGDVLHAF